MSEKPETAKPLTREQELTNENEQLKAKMAQAVQAIRSDQPNIAIEILTP